MHRPRDLNNEPKATEVDAGTRLSHAELSHLPALVIPVLIFGSDDTLFSTHKVKLFISLVDKSI
jgi:hypothetical protein